MSSVLCISNDVCVFAQVKTSSLSMQSNAAKCACLQHYFALPALQTHPGYLLCEVFCGEEEDWYEAQVIDLHIENAQVKVHYVGGDEAGDEWVAINPRTVRACQPVRKQEESEDEGGEEMEQVCTSMKCHAPICVSFLIEPCHCHSQCAPNTLLLSCTVCLTYCRSHQQEEQDSPSAEKHGQGNGSSMPSHEDLLAVMSSGVSVKEAIKSFSVDKKIFRGWCRMYKMPRWNSKRVRNARDLTERKAAAAIGEVPKKSRKLREHERALKVEAMPNFKGRGRKHLVSTTKKAFQALYPDGFHSVHKNIPPLSEEQVLENDRLRVLHDNMFATHGRPSWS